jgi:hypothetical protein
MFIFQASSKWHLEFTKLTKIVEIEAFKMLKKCLDLVNFNVKTFKTKQGKIQNIDSENVTRQPFNHSTKLNLDLFYDQVTHC